MPKPTNFCAVRPSVAFGSTARRLPGWRADCPPGREIGFRPTTSGLPLETDIVRAGRHVSKVPEADLSVGLGPQAPPNRLLFGVHCFPKGTGWPCQRRTADSDPPNGRRWWRAFCLRSSSQRAFTPDWRKSLRHQSTLVFWRAGPVPNGYCRKCVSGPCFGVWPIAVGLKGGLSSSIASKRETVCRTFPLSLPSW